MHKQLAFYFDSSACSGCKTCQIACMDKNNHAPGTHWRRVYEVSGGGWEKREKCWVSNVYAYNISLSCNHCAEPVCLKNCPAKAITKREDGIVLTDPQKCMGCKYCQWNCPYGAPHFDEQKGVMEKCNLCYDYIDSGKNPICVDACPTRSLHIGDYDALLIKYGQNSQVYPLPNPEITRPSLLLTPHKDAAWATAENPEVSNMEEIKHA